jgi:hypothetical protein
MGRMIRITNRGRLLRKGRTGNGETDKVTKAGWWIRNEKMVTKLGEVDEEREGWETGRMRRVAKKRRLLRRRGGLEWKR